MATYMNDKKKLVTINSVGPIPLLGNIVGPVLAPNYVSLRVITNLVQAGYMVDEINPLDYNDTVRLTIQNVNLDNFSNSTKTVSKVTEAIPEVTTTNVPEVAVDNTTDSTTTEVTEDQTTNSVTDSNDFKNKKKNR